MTAALVVPVDSPPAVTDGCCVLTVPQALPCPECDGFGNVYCGDEDDMPDACDCVGDDPMLWGMPTLAPPGTPIVVVVQEACADCGGSGRNLDGYCGNCHGGYVGPAAVTLVGKLAGQVPIVDDCDDMPGTPALVELHGDVALTYWPEGMDEPGEEQDWSHLLPIHNLAPGRTLVRLVDVRVLAAPLTEWDPLPDCSIGRECDDTMHDHYRSVSSLPDTVSICPPALWAAIEEAL